MAPKGLPFSFHALETVESNTDVLEYAKAWVGKHNFQPSIVKFGNLKIAGVNAGCQIASCKYHSGCDKKFRFSRRDARIFAELSGSCYDRDACFGTRMVHIVLLHWKYIVLRPDS